MYEVPPPQPPSNLTCPRCGSLAMSFWEKALMIRPRRCRGCGVRLGLPKTVTLPIGMFGALSSILILRTTGSWLLLMIVIVILSIVAGVIAAELSRLAVI